MADPRALPFALAAALLGSACGSVAPVAEAPEPDGPARVLVDAMVFDVPADGFTMPEGAVSFGDLIEQTGARYVVSPHALIADDELTRMSRWPAFSDQPNAVGRAFETYRLDIKPQVVEPGRVRLAIAFDLAAERVETTVELADEQTWISPTDVTVDDRRFVLIVRPTIIRRDDDLRALLEERSSLARARRSR